MCVSSVLSSVLGVDIAVSMVERRRDFILNLFKFRGYKVKR